MEKKVVNLSVKLPTLFNDKDERQTFGFVFNEIFEARKADGDTGEFVITTDNRLTFTKKQFVFMMKDNFIVNLLNNSLDFSTISTVELIGIFKDAKFVVERTKLEEGDEYIGIDGETMTAEHTMFLTEIKDVKFDEKNIKFIKMMLVKIDSNLDMDMLDLIL